MRPPASTRSYYPHPPTSAQHFQQLNQPALALTEQNLFVGQYEIMRQALLQKNQQKNASFQSGSQNGQLSAREHSLLTQLGMN